jgi:hypothetical protein
LVAFNSKQGVEWKNADERKGEERMVERGM